MRLLNNILAKNSLEHYRKGIWKPSGRPEVTFVSMMKKDLQNISLTWENVIELTKKGNSV